MSAEAEHTIRSSLKDEDMVLKVYAMPAGRLDEGDFLKYCYPEKDQVVYGLHAVLHSLRDLLNDKMKMLLQRIELHRGGRRMVAVFHETQGYLVCFLWTIGEVGGGMIPASVGMGGDLKVTGTPHGLEVHGSKIQKISLNSESMTLTLPDAGVKPVVVTRETAARLQRFANAFPGKVKHNIRQRLPHQTLQYVTATSETILSTMLTLWPSLQDAFASSAQLTSLLSDISSTLPSTTSCFTGCFSPILLANVSRDIHAIIPPPRPPLDPGHVSGAKYTSVGEIICFRGKVVSSTVDLEVCKVVLFYLQSTRFTEAGNVEDVLVDSLILKGEKGLLVAYQAEGLLGVAVMRPSRQRGLGVTQVEIVASLKKVLEGLRNKGLFHAEEKSAPVLPEGVHRYQLTHRKGLVTTANGTSDPFATEVFSTLSGFISDQLQTNTQYTLSFEVPKSKKTLTITGWAHEDDTLIVLHDAEAQPSLPCLYCDLVAGIPI